MIPNDPKELLSYLKHFLVSEEKISAELFNKLVEFSTTPNQVLREHVLKLLGRSQREEAFNILIPQLSERYRHFRAAAVYGLGELGNLDAIPEVERLLSDPALAVRQEAEIAFKKLSRHN